MPGNKSDNQCGGVCWPPVLGLTDDEVTAVSPVLLGWLDILNEDDVRKGCRIALWIDRSTEARAALLRHEIEHSRQLAVHGVDLAGLHELAEAILGGVPGSGLLYQQVPMEADANAAASIFVRERFGEGVIDRLIEDGHPDSAVFRRGGPPGPIDALMDRMIDFFVDQADLCMEWARAAEMNFAGVLGCHYRQGRRAWCERTGLTGNPNS